MRSIVIIGLLVLAVSAPADARQTLHSTQRPGADAPAAPWPARVRLPLRGLEKGYGFVDPHAAAPEPESPTKVKPERLAEGLAVLCYRLGNKKSEQYAKWIVRYAKEFSVDPFLLGALIRRQSGCSERTPRRHFGVGLARISPAVHKPFLRNGIYRYFTKERQAWLPQELKVDRFRFSRRSLARPETNIYFAAAILAVYSRQHTDLDEAFPQAPHRHAVSHLLWGDRVRGTEGEERILRDRRKLLEYYSGKRPAPKNSYKGMPIHCPLDGIPRKITSGYYARRGHRGHKSIDFYSHVGEPVRAMADGVVRFAGYQRRRGHGRNVSPKYVRRIRRRSMGIGGVFVIIKHKKGIETGYFHLKDYVVRPGQRVRAGELIGRVGRTGIKQSRAHLHFEIRKGRWRRKVNPMRFFTQGDVLPLDSTWVGQGIETRRLRKIRYRRAARKQRQLKARKRRKRARHRRAPRKKALRKTALKNRATKAPPAVSPVSRAATKSG